MKWYKELCNQSSQYQFFESTHSGIWFVRDDNSILEVLDKHKNVETSENYESSYYQLLKVKGMSDSDDKTFVPIIPGYSIITYISNSFFRFTIKKNIYELLIYEWIDYGSDMTLNQITYQSSKNDYFLSFYKYIEKRQKGSYSISTIIGLNNANNANHLRAAVINKFPENFVMPKNKNFLAAEKNTKSIKNSMKRKGEMIMKEITNLDRDSPLQKKTIIKSGIIVDEDGLEMDEKSTQGLLAGLAEYRQKYYQSNKKLKQAKDSMTRARESICDNSDNLTEQEKIDFVVKQAIENNNLGSTILINTQGYLKLLFEQACVNCKNKSIDNKKCEIFNVGFSMRTKIRCLTCGDISEHSNEPPNSSLSLLIAGSSLVAGLNRQQNETFLASMGITNQICKKAFHDHQKKFFQILTVGAEESAKEALIACISYVKSLGQNILSVSFDTSWSHVRNANQASGELIFQGDHPDYDHKPVIAYHVVEKSRVARNGNEESKIIHQGNFDKSSKQMEHAILITILEKITLILDEHDILLDIGVDGDLENNKTLKNQRQVNKVFGDLMHITKNIRKKIGKNNCWRSFEQPIMQYYRNCVYAATLRKETPELETPTDDELFHLQVNGLVAHLSGDHSLCWDEVCWLKNNSELELKEPNLLKYSNIEREAFRKMLRENLTTKTNQSLITHIRTSYNEAFNRKKNVYLDKKIDFWQSFAARHSLAVINHNKGLLESIGKIRLITGLEALTSEDTINIKKFAKFREDQGERNVTKIQERNRERSEKIMQQNEELKSFNFDQDLIPYGKEFQKRMESSEYKPSFAHLIRDFSTISKCLACHSFPKVSSTGMCRACNFYLKHGMQNRFPDKSFKLPIYSTSNSSLSLIQSSSISLIPLLVKEYFGYSEYKECQREGISSFVKGKDTMVLLPTGGGKTLCYSASALLCEGLTVVFSPLKALIEDQVIEVTRMGIPCAGLYTTNGHSTSYQKKVFEEISSGFTRILFVTPEKFEKNIGFQKMLCRIYEQSNLRLVIDEVHCIKEYKYFRPSWNNLGKLRDIYPEAPIMMLTATCSKEDADIICGSLNIKPENLNIIRGSSFSRPEIKIEVCSKGSKEKVINEIIKLIGEVEEGKAIIYCSTVKGCEEMLEQLNSKVDPNYNIDIYHGELDGLKKCQTMQKWKNDQTHLMIATNAFGMGINTSDIRLVIHNTFPLNMGNLIQEIGRGGRDKIQSKSVLFFSRNDIRSIYSIVTGGRESSIENQQDINEANTNGNQQTNFVGLENVERSNYLLNKQKEIFKVVYYCEEPYTCRQVMLSNYYSWPNDQPVPQCRTCNNCIRYANDKPSIYDISNDVVRMLKVVDAVVNHLKIKEKEATRDDIIDVFCQARNKNAKENNFSELEIYKLAYNRVVKRRDDALHLLDRLIIDSLVLSHIVLYKTFNLSNFHYSILIIGLKEGAIAETMSKKWEILLKK